MASDLTVTQAVNRAAETGVDISGDTIRYWCTRHGLGRKVFGIYHIKPERLERILTGATGDHVAAE